MIFKTISIDSTPIFDRESNSRCLALFLYSSVSKPPGATIIMDNLRELLEPIADWFNL